MSIEITIRDAAARVPLSQRQIKYLLKKGAIKGRKIGGRRRGMWLVDLDSLLAYVERMREERDGR